MKVLHVCKHFHPQVTGVTVHVRELSRRLLLMGHQVEVASFGDTPEEELDGLRVFRARPGDAAGLEAILMRLRPDVIHAHSIWEHVPAGIAASARLGRPLVLTVHGTWQFLHHTRRPWRLRLAQDLILRRLRWPGRLRQAQRVIALNALEEADILRLGMPSDRVRRIPNAVDASRFTPASPQPDQTGHDRPFRVGFAGAIQAQKGVFVLLEALARLRAQGLNISLALAGEGPESAEAKAGAMQLGLGQAVTFSGRVPPAEMPEFYRRCSAFALPSREEPFATALLEAMASGLPCLGVAEGGTPEIVVHGETGLLVPPEDPQAVACGLAHLARNTALSHSMGLAGRERVSLLFDWSVVAPRIAAVYREVAP